MKKRGGSLMIATLTFNPSLDYIIHVDHFEKGKINRTSYEHILAGGKGINVSWVLSNLGHKSTAMGFLAGFTGRQIEAMLQERGIDTDFIYVKEGLSRINVKMKSEEETEINGQGPRIQDEDLQKLYEKLDQLENGDILVISGSIPNTLPSDMYERILERLKNKGILFVVDAEKDLLSRVLKYHPFLIKPNNHELGEMYHVSLKTKDDVIPYAAKLQKAGARNVLVSLAGEGAVLLDEAGNIHKAEAPKGTLVNSVGAGDSMVAGFLAGYLETKDYATAFRFGLCSGSASAFSAELCRRDEMEALLKQCQ